MYYTEIQVPQILATYTRSSRVFLNPLFTTGIVLRTIGFSAPYPSNFVSLRFQCGLERANGSTLSTTTSQRLSGYTEYFVVNALLTFDDIPFHCPLRSRYTNVSGADCILIYIDRYAHKHWMIFRRTILYCTNLGPTTGASFQTMRDLLSAAFPSTQVYDLVEFVNEPLRPRSFYPKCFTTGSSLSTLVLWLQDCFLPNRDSQCHPGRPVVQLPQAAAMDSRYFLFALML